MSCTYENFTMAVSNHADKLAKLFLRYFKDDLYWDISEIQNGILSTELHPNGSGAIEFQNEPFFNSELGMDDKIFNFFMTFCAKFPDVKADYSYFADWNDDNSCVLSSYKYADGFVEGETRHCYDYVFCKECGWREFDDDIRPPFSIYNFDSNKEYTCPNCGKALDVGAWKVENLKGNILDFGLTQKDLDEFEI